MRKCRAAEPNARTNWRARERIDRKRRTGYGSVGSKDSAWIERTAQKGRRGHGGSARWTLLARSQAPQPGRKEARGSNLAGLFRRKGAL